MRSTMLTMLVSILLGVMATCNPAAARELLGAPQPLSRPSFAPGRHLSWSDTVASWSSADTSSGLAATLHARRVRPELTSVEESIGLDRHSTTGWSAASAA